jgi:hypothetical protein
MKIKLNRDPKQLELLKLAGSKNKEVSAQAMEILAGFISPIIQQVIEKAGLSDAIYSKVTFNQDDQPSIPLDFYIDKKVDYVRVWSQSIAGGLPTNQISGLQELKVSTYTIDSAVSFLKRYARLGQLDHIARALQFMAQEILVKTETNSWTPILAALGSASTNSLAHVISAATVGSLTLEDFSKLITRAKKINAASIDGGTPVASGVRGVTDLFLGITGMEAIRSWTYNPLNTKAGVTGTGGTPTGSSVGIPAPEAFRSQIYANAGLAEVWGLKLHEVYELESDAAYSVIFDNYYQNSFTPGTNSLIVGVDMSREALIKPVEVDDNGNEVGVFADDQWTQRSEKLGFFSRRVEGSCVLDDRCLTGLLF